MNNYKKRVELMQENQKLINEVNILKLRNKKLKKNIYEYFDMDYKNQNTKQTCQFIQKQKMANDKIAHLFYTVAFIITCLAFYLMGLTK